MGGGGEGHGRGGGASVVTDPLTSPLLLIGQRFSKLLGCRCCRAAQQQAKLDQKGLDQTPSLIMQDGGEESRIGAEKDRLL